MQIDLISVDKFIKVNNLQEVTDPIMFEKGAVPTTKGLLSTEIFGSSLKDRKDIFAYVKLNGHYLQPFVYKLLRRLNRNFESLIHGNRNFVIVNGDLVEDEEKGETGLEFLYKNWENLKFKKNDSTMRNERIDVLNAYDKNTLFTQYWIIIPAFLRDVNLQSTQGKISHHEINDKYAKLIRNASILNSDNNFDFELNRTRASIQMTLVEIYDLLKSKIEKKNGLIRKSLLGKSVDYGVRTVISAPVFKAERPEDMAVSFYNCGIPLAQCCSLFTPFITAWVKSFFQREIESLGGKCPVRNSKGEIEYVELDEPESYFTEDYIKKQIDRFIFGYNDRFVPVELPTKDPRYKKGLYMAFAGRFHNSNDPASTSELINRPATWCDILYQAAVDVTSDKMVWVTRYPLLDYFGMFPAKVTVLSTHDTIPVSVGSKVYADYPKIDLDMPRERISVYFTDTLTMSNLFLTGLGGDYDGDQVTVKGVFSQEANKEAEAIMRSKSHILSIYGKNMRKTTNEGIQTLYMLTKFDNQ